SAPQERTVRSLTFDPKPEKHPLWYRFEKQWRTVRPPGPDRPRAHQRHCKLSGTVADCPPLWAGLSATLGRTVRQPTRDSASSLERARTVRPSGADCPPLLSQLSNLVFFKSFQNVVSPHACN